MSTIRPLADHMKPVYDRLESAGAEDMAVEVMRLSAEYDLIWEEREVLRTQVEALTVERDEARAKANLYLRDLDVHNSTIARIRLVLNPAK